MKDVLNARVKRREGFRPFAPAVLAERRDEYFDGGYESPFMLLVENVRPDKRAELGAVTHVDGTARVQDVERGSNPRFYDLIAAFGQKTGTPVLLNTSFNVRGEPIVNTPEQAIHGFLDMDMDALVLGDQLLCKENGSPVRS
jgi:carbamoyltransferase